MIYILGRPCNVSMPLGFSGAGRALSPRAYEPSLCKCIYSSLVSCCWQHSTDGRRVLGYQTCDLMWLHWHFLPPSLTASLAHNGKHPSALSPYWSPFGQGLFPPVLLLPIISLSLISWSTTDPCSQDERSCNWRLGSGGGVDSRAIEGARMSEEE